MQDTTQNYERSLRRWPLVIAILVIAAGGLLIWQVQRPPEIKDSFALVRQALTDLEQGRTDSFARAIEAFDDRPEYELHLRLLDAALFLHGGRIEQSLQELAQVPPVGEFHRPVLFYTARAMLQQNRAAQAEALLRELAEKYPDDVDVHRWLGILYFDLGAYDPALVAMQRVADLAPEDYRPHRLMGLMYRDFQRTTESIEHYQAALQRTPPKSVRREIILELANSLIENLQYEDALQSLDEVSGDSAARTLRARCLHGTGRPDEAELLVQAVLTDSSDDRDALLLSAQIQREGGELKAALESADRVTKVHPYDPEGWYQTGLILAEIGDSSAADRAMEQWQHLKDLHTRLTELNFEALSRPHDAQLRQQIADLCDQLGKPELAARWRTAAAAGRGAIPAGSSSPTEADAQP